MVAHTCGSGVDYAARLNDDREPTDVDLDELRELEAAMWRSETRGDRSWIHATRPVRDSVSQAGGGVVLVTYQSEVDGLLANRSSIWRLTDASRQMEFHQGTLTSAR